MLESVNHSIFHLLSAPRGLSGAELLFSLALAQWAILVGPALLVFIWVFGEPADRRAAVSACLSGLLALAVAVIISSLYFHPRPFADGLARNILQHVPDSSFPSDHATLFFALGWSLLFTRPPSFARVWTIPTIVAAAVGWSRVFLGVHYPLDVVGAAIVALAAATSFARGIGARASAALTDLGVRIYDWPLSDIRSNQQPR